MAFLDYLLSDQDHPRSCHLKPPKKIVSLIGNLWIMGISNIIVLTIKVPTFFVPTWRELSERSFKNLHGVTTLHHQKVLTHVDQEVNSCQVDELLPSDSIKILNTCLCFIVWFFDTVSSKPHRKLNENIDATHHERDDLDNKLNFPILIPPLIAPGNFLFVDFKCVLSHCKVTILMVHVVAKASKISRSFYDLDIIVNKCHLWRYVLLTVCNSCSVRSRQRLCLLNFWLEPKNACKAKPKGEQQITYVDKIPSPSLFHSLSVILPAKELRIDSLCHIQDLIFEQQLLLEQIDLTKLVW